ncbi:four-carbon acid sugar kinase family protein [uncultured Cohaesibacter sp.]|uniref:four-carbon acid sugar kinase family protein n=1 Tax=uncultured Cohaesibacter sp. TaxID=1002546 RepID=UPI002931796D|nr:four-carbon acid sugar kinase family protein [uncultured Cohaesibacter sp.]
MEQVEKLAIIADDFTGAGDAGVHFSRCGTPTKLFLHLPSPDSLAGQEGTVSITTETRFLSVEDARETVSNMVRRCREAGFERFYKKIDSTMRGNPGGEIEAALEASGCRAALVCTAMPETGRSCEGGTIYLDGQPLHLTEIGSDPFHPLSMSNVVDLVHLQTHMKSANLPIAAIEAGAQALQERIGAMLEDGVRLIVADATLSDHLDTLAQVVRQLDLLPAGAGGFARAIAHCLSNVHRPTLAQEHVQMDGPLLSIIGSLTKTSLRQADIAEKSGLYQTISIPPRGSAQEIATICRDQMHGSNLSEANILLRVENGKSSASVTREQGDHVAHLLAQAATEICKRLPIKTIFSTGGGTSIVVAEALGIGSIRLMDELMPGIVLGACQANRNNIDWFISKAGGFGNDTLLTDIAGLLSDPLLEECGS